MARILAFDPGLKGGVACDSDGEIACYPMPVSKSGDGLDERTLVKLFWDVQPDLIVIERVQCILAEDKNGERTRVNGAASMFTFGEGYGVLRGIARAWQVSSGRSVQIDYPLPTHWKPVILPGRTKGKQGAIDYCRENFPEINLVLPRCTVEHTGIADALCLLRYGQKILEAKSA